MGPNTFGGIQELEENRYVSITSPESENSHEGAHLPFPFIKSVPDFLTEFPCVFRTRKACLAILCWKRCKAH